MCLFFRVCGVGVCPTLSISYLTLWDRFVLILLSMSVRQVFHKELPHAVSFRSSPHCARAKSWSSHHTLWYPGKLSCTYKMCFYFLRQINLHKVLLENDPRLSIETLFPGAFPLPTTCDLMPPCLISITVLTLGRDWRTLGQQCHPV